MSINRHSVNEYLATTIPIDWNSGGVFFGTTQAPS